jgi:peptide deformylase
MGPKKVNHVTKTYRIFNINDNDSILKIPTKNVDLRDIPKLSGIIQKMISIIKEEKALGLSANQIGINKSICIVMPDYSKIKVMINPIIKSEHGPKVYSYESCLSCKLNKTYRVIRNLSIDVGYYNEFGSYIEETIDDPNEARVTQHEIDHLMGVLLVDKEIR